MTCNTAGNWGGCVNQGECAKGTTQEQTCNTNGTQTKTCGDNCYWSNWSTCSSTGCVCSSGDCCDGCNYESTNVDCDAWTEYQCDGNTIEKRTITQYCSGNSAACGGDTDYSSWSLSKTCSSGYTCEQSGDTPTCVAEDDIDSFSIKTRTF